MSKWLRRDETELINWLTTQGDFIRTHGRFPFVRRTMAWLILGIIGLALFAFVEFAFLETDKAWRPNPVILILTISLLLQTIQRFALLRLKKISTGLPMTETAEVIETELRRLGYGAMWTDGKGVGIMRLETSTGFGKERHILVLVPDNGHMWITAIDATSPFAALNTPRPFRRLLKRLRMAMTESVRHEMPATGTT